MQQFFKIKERGSSVRVEIVGGIVTFFSMAYIIFVNPSYQAAAGMDFFAVAIATCISAAIGCFLTAFLTNMPFAQAPCMGLNAFFTYTICFGWGYSWQQALGIVFISSLVFLTLMLTPFRRAVLAAIPPFLKDAISAGVGLFIAFIGLVNAQIIVGFGNGPGFYTALGNITQGTPLLAIIGLIITSVLIAYDVKGAVFISIIVTTIIGVPMGLTVYEPMQISLDTLSLVVGKLSFSGLLDKGLLPLVTAVVSFTIIDIFDTSGAIISMAGSVGIDHKEFSEGAGGRVLIADAMASAIGAVFGTSTVSTYIESATGIQAGARTGLSNIVVGLLFIAAIFLAPFAGMIPVGATAPALIVVGIFMMGTAAGIDWSDFEQAVPAFLTVVIMPFAYSISDGIGFGFISYTVIKVFRGKYKEVPPMIYVISMLFLVLFILSNYSP